MGTRSTRPSASPPARRSSAHPTTRSTGRSTRAERLIELEREAAQATRQPAARHAHLAASYRALRDHYQQKEQGFAQAMVARQEWAQATAGSRRLAIAADTELRRRHPHQKIEPLRSGEPAAVSDTGREQLSPGLDEKLTERVTRIRDLAAQRKASTPRWTSIQDG